MHRRIVTRPWRNWSGSVRCHPGQCVWPGTIEEVQAEVLRAAEEGQRLRVVGGGHAFSPLCWSDDTHMSLAHFTGIESLDGTRRRVWVRAGTSLGEIGARLAQRGLALENLGEGDAHTIGGALSTGFHGSGLNFGSLASQVTGLRLVCADGTVKTLDADSGSGLFDAARLALGALGVITHVELRCVANYRLHRYSVKSTLHDTLAHLDQHLRTHRNFEFFWFACNGAVQQRIADETSTPASQLPLRMLAGEYLVENAGLWVVSQLARRMPSASERLSRLAAWAAPERADVREARRAYSTPRHVRYHEIEYAVPIERAGEVLLQIERVMRALKFPVHLPLRVRFVKGDDAWLSPGYQRDSAYIAAHVFHAMPHEDFFAALAELFDRSEGRPHWGKWHDKSVHDFVPLYPRFDDFCRLRQSLDPRGVFVNPALGSIFDVEWR